jgi:hypothetical protein
LCRTRAHTRTVRRIAEVTGIVEAAVETAARARQPLQHVIDCIEASLCDVRLVDEHARCIEVERAATDARARDHDFALAVGLR